MDQASGEERLAVLRQVLEDVGKLVGGDHKLLHRSSQQWICRRVQQQIESSETTLLWHLQSETLVQADLPGFGRLSIVFLDTPISGLITAIPKEPRELHSFKHSGAVGYHRSDLYRIRDVPAGE